jgi:hypothetical protein
MPRLDRVQSQATTTQNKHHFSGPAAALRKASAAPAAEKFRAAAASAQKAQASGQTPHEDFRIPVQVVLPPSTGIEVEDAVYPWPEKTLDAVEGWVDNRGEFQFY